jgi:hypothetical protein
VHKTDGFFIAKFQKATWSVNHFPQWKKKFTKKVFANFLQSNKLQKVYRSLNILLIRNVTFLKIETNFVSCNLWEFRKRKKKP